MSGPRPGPPPSVAVLLGTDHHPYDRAVRWAAELAAEDGSQWFVQHGFTPWPLETPASLSGAPMLGIDELTRVMDVADVVITHGGPGLIMEARAARHVPIVIPRDPDLGEHVDSHQLDFAARLRDEGTIRLVSTLDELRDAVRLTREQGRPEHGHAGHRSDTVLRFGELVEAARARPRRRLLRR
ncbi:glycosyltransferase [Nocardioides gilvus]|uniref:glycosyltransferase n=1 Tax=Nocardioides gilvus TaxID=1735589 RepID=UPI000D74B89F|nr:glycosyltransferase [Nocardioides gilvus]